MIILETRTLKGTTVCFRRWWTGFCQGQVVVDINIPQEEGEDAMVLFESHLVCIAVCTLNLSIGSTINVQPNGLPELNPFPASLQISSNANYNSYKMHIVLF